MLAGLSVLDSVCSIVARLICGRLSGYMVKKRNIYCSVNKTSEPLPASLSVTHSPCT